MSKSPTVKKNPFEPQRKHPKPPKRYVHAEVAKREKAAKKAEFLQAYEQGGAIYWASAKVGVSHDTIDRWRKEDAVFDNAVMETYERTRDTLKMSAYLRAVKGSDNLAMFFLKQHDPSFRDHYMIDGRHMHAGVISTPNKVPASVQAAVDAIALDLVIKMAEKL